MTYLEGHATAFTAVKPATDAVVIIGCHCAFVAAAAMSAKIDMTIMVNLLSVAPPASFIINLFSLPSHGRRYFRSSRPL